MAAAMRHGLAGVSRPINDGRLCGLFGVQQTFDAD
jgi:hypothetical protein